MFILLQGKNLPAVLGSWNVQTTFIFTAYHFMHLGKEGSRMEGTLKKSY